MTLEERISAAIKTGLADIKDLLAKLTGKDSSNPATETAAPPAAVDATKVVELQGQFTKLAADVEQLTKDLGTARQTISTLQTDKTKLETDLKAANDKFAIVEAELKDPKGTASQLAAEIVAGTGIVGALAIAPSTTAGGGTENTEASLLARLKAETDFAKKFQISEQIAELRKKASGKA